MTLLQDDVMFSLSILKLWAYRIIHLCYDQSSFPLDTHLPNPTLKNGTERMASSKTN